MSTSTYSPAAGGEPAIHAAGVAVTRAQGVSNWADLSRPYLHDVVVPTMRDALRLLSGA